MVDILHIDTDNVEMSSSPPFVRRVVLNTNVLGESCSWGELFLGQVVMELVAAERVFMGLLAALVVLGWIVTWLVAVGRVGEFSWG